MRELSSVAELRAATAPWRRAGERIAFVPTMGALHEGHLTLMRRAQEGGARLVVSIFVNPTQFDRAADLDAYPHDPEGDRAKLREVGCELLFTTTKDAMYPEGYATWVNLEGSLVEGLCGRTRGHHFRGVATIVTKLLNIVTPDVAVFGRKDYQQLAIIRRMVRDLDLPVEVLGLDTVREPDGLALSSRNLLLSPERRAAAVAIPRALAQLQRRYVAGERDAAAALAALRAELEAAGGRVDYAEAVDAHDLSPKARLDDETLVALAAFFGEVRLIDNHLIARPFPVEVA